MLKKLKPGMWFSSQEEDFSEVGVPKPFASFQIIPEDYLVMNGDPFDKVKYPRLAKVFPSGYLPDLRDLFIRGYGPNDSANLLEKQQGSRQVMGLADGRINGSTAIHQVNYVVEKNPSIFNSKEVGLDYILNPNPNFHNSWVEPPKASVPFDDTTKEWKWTMGHLTGIVRPNNMAWVYACYAR